MFFFLKSYRLQLYSLVVITFIAIIYRNARRRSSKERQAKLTLIVLVHRTHKEQYGTQIAVR